MPGANTAGAHPKTAPPPSLPSGPNGYGVGTGVGKATSALDAPLTEAQIATLPPALQAVLRKKQAENTGVPPVPPVSSVSSVSSLALEPVAPAADDLTPEQRAVLAEIRRLECMSGQLDRWQLYRKPKNHWQLQEESDDIILWLWSYDQQL